MYAWCIIDTTLRDVKINLVYVRHAGGQKKMGGEGKEGRRIGSVALIPARVT